MDDVRFQGPGGPPGVPPTPMSADAAISHLYEHHYAGLVRLAAMIMRASSRADEIVQDAFVEAYRRWDTIADPAKAVAYIRRSVVNRCTSAHRHLGVADRHQQAAGHELRNAPSAEHEALGHETHDRVLAAVDALPDQQRTVMLLRYFNGLSEAEIADTMGISAGSVKSHASRAAKALRVSLEPLR